MPSHRFKIGQTVALLSSRTARAMPAGQYIVVRLLPLVDHEPHYRAKSVTEGTEWALVESQMLPVAASEPLANQPDAPVSQ